MGKRSDGLGGVINGSEVLAGGEGGLVFVCMFEGLEVVSFPFPFPFWCRSVSRSFARSWELMASHSFALSAIVDSVFDFMN
jgi:hypothetical protein